MDPYDELIKLYNDGERIKDILEKLGISYGVYYRLFKWAKSEGLIEPRGSGYRKNDEERAPTHMSRTNAYYDYYTISYNGEYYCNVKGYGNAVKVVERLKACGWDKSQAKEIKRSVLSESV